MKKEFVSIRWSDIAKECWFEIVIVNPSEFRAITIPGKNAFVAFRAYFPMMTNKRVFDIVLPYYQFERALKAIPQELRSDLSRPVKFEFMKTDKSELHIRNWEVL